MHLRPERQQFLHSGSGGGSFPGSHRSGDLLLSTHLGASDSGQSYAFPSVHNYSHLFRFAKGAINDCVF